MTPEKKEKQRERDSKLAYGTPAMILEQARSLLWAAQHMQGLLHAAANAPNPDSFQLIGCFFSTTMLRAFAAEIALKGLYQKIIGEYADQTHDLSELFDSLPQTVQNDLDAQFKAVCRVKPGYDGPDTIKEVLSNHKDDFVTFRYILFKPPQAPKKANTKPLDLEPAVEAIIQIGSII